MGLALSVDVGMVVGVSVGDGVAAGAWLWVWVWVNVLHIYAVERGIVCVSCCLFVLRFVNCMSGWF